MLAHLVSCSHCKGVMGFIYCTVFRMKIEIAGSRVGNEWASALSAQQSSNYHRLLYKNVPLFCEDVGLVKLQPNLQNQLVGD